MADGKCQVGSANRRVTLGPESQLMTVQVPGSSRLPPSAFDLGPQLLGALKIATGHGHSQGEFEFFELMTAFAVTAVLAGWGASGSGGVAWAGAGAMAVCEGHGSLSSHCGTAAKGQAAMA